jgi:AAA15 family ATPase/GTPase
MIDSLHIQNYRLFKDLKIDKLGQVNLIAGKNNTGKTALLEAIRILESDASNYVINDILSKRGDFEFGNSSCFFSLFKDYKTNKTNKSIQINDLSLVDVIGVHVLVKFGKSYTLDSTNLFLNDIYQKFSLEADTLIPNINNGNVIFIPLVFETENDVKFWDNISLTPKEQDVIEIIKIVDNRIKIVRFDSGNIKVLLEGEDRPRLLKNLGEGINRLFTIALALVNAQKKILLIDEFEVGLHHSIQEQLWEIIFKYSQKWNIQVFVTTHSRDTVEAFHNVSTKEDYKDMGQYMRLQKSSQSDDIEVVIYTEKSLDTAFDLNLETR